MKIDPQTQEEYFQSLREGFGYELAPEKLRDPHGKLLTKSLFYELAYSKLDYTRFTVTHADHHLGYHSFHRLLVELNDPSEYLPAMVLLGSWDHWLRLRANPTVAQMIAYANTEIAAREYTNAINRIREIAQSPKNPKLAFQAAKYLASKEHREFKRNLKRLSSDDKQHPKRGRPLKDHTEELEKQRILREQDVNEDYERITSLLTSVK